MTNTNNGENYGSSPSFKKNQGRLAKLQPKERKEIARKGGLAKSEKKRLNNQLNAIKTGKYTDFHISKCNECPLNKTCDYYKKDSACKIEINIKRNVVNQFKAFVGNNPEDMLKEIMRQYKNLEKEAQTSPTYTKNIQMLYLLIKIYEMKYHN